MRYGRRRDPGPRRSRVTPAVAGTVALIAFAATAPAQVAARASCPLGPNIPTTSDVQWAFSINGLPAGTHRGISASYTHGHGTWAGGRASGGAVCHQDKGGAIAERHVVMRMAHVPARLKGHVTRLGKLGVEIVLPVVVSASDDRSCARGTRGTVTLFASYYDIHVDSAALRFAAGCRAHDHEYRGRLLKVLITRHGAQVN